VTGRIAALVGAAGVAATWFAAVALNMPAHEALKIGAIASGAALAAGLAGVALLRALRRRSVGLQVTIVALVSVVAAAGGSLLAARAMFLAPRDLEALVVILLASSTVGVLVAVGLGRRVSVASRSLREATRRIGGGDLKTSVAEPATEEFSALARELEMMSRRLDGALERERALDASRRELTAWVSHDLRTPLAGIRAMAEALEDGVVADPETVARYHRTLRVDAERLAHLVDGLFELSVIASGALRLQIERVSLGDLVSDALASAAASARARGVRVEGHMAGTAPQVELSGPEVTRVLRNLLENAIRHTPSDGSVWVEAGIDGDVAYVAVTDECGGIPEADLGRVFELAFRGQAARTPSTNGGAGLGLAIAQGIVDAHHGEISVCNGSAGCRFTVRLPVSQARWSSPS
jgi:signal transduction histidine kinase